MLQSEIEAAIEEKRKDKLPYEHYKALIKDRDPQEMARNAACMYDEAAGVLTLRMVGRNWNVKYPDGDVYLEGKTISDDYKSMTMVLRYLLDAKGVESTGETIAYRDISGGNHYFKSFEGRCLKRLAFTFGHKPEGFKKAMEALGAEKLELGDISYRFEFINNMYLTAILWLADEEFPPEAQILFDKNVSSAFDAEDMAVMGDIFIPILKQLSQ